MAAARALYERSPDAAQLAAFGLTAADYDDEYVEVWPDVWPAVQLFLRLSTQWRIAMGGATGLDYNVLYRMMDRLSLSPAEYDQLEGDIQIMEREALEVMAESRE